MRSFTVFSILALGAVTSVACVGEIGGGASSSAPAAIDSASPDDWGNGDEWTEPADDDPIDDGSGGSGGGGAAPDPEPPPEEEVCVPLTCSDVSPSCGAISDGCQGTLQCGCLNGSSCVNGTCACPSTPQVQTRTAGKVTSDADPATPNAVKWDDAGWAAAEDGNYAKASLGPKAKSQRLVASSFGFSIPADATIDAIVLSVRRKKVIHTGNGVIQDLAVKLMLDGQAVGASFAGQDWTTADTWATYGQLDPGLAPTQLNFPGFGASVRAQSLDDKDTNTAKVDGMKIDVYFYPACEPTSG
jgi:hypothetical protein